MNCNKCGHDVECHHDGAGNWALGCNQPIAMEMGCPCYLSYYDLTKNETSPIRDLITAAKAYPELRETAERAEGELCATNRELR